MQYKTLITIHSPMDMGTMGRLLSFMAKEFHKAYELGLFESIAETDPHGAGCYCEEDFPCECYRPVEWIKEGE